MRKSTRSPSRSAALSSLVVLVLSACTLQVTAPVEPPPEMWDPSLNTHPNGAGYQALLERYVFEGIPGVVLYVKTPAGIWNGAAGFAKIEADEPMLPTHLHHAASVTKMYTAAATLLIAQDGLIDLDTRLGDYLPDTVCTRIPNCSEATVRQLLRHTSGIPDFNGDLAYDLDFMSDPLGDFPTDKLLSYLYSQSAWSTPGSYFFYSNANYFLLALVLDHVVEGGHSSVISDRILQPLGLNSTFYRNEPGFPTPSGLVNSYEDLVGDGRLMNVTDMVTHNADVFFGNAGLIASAADYAAFVEALLEGAIVGLAMTAQMQEWGSRRYGLGLNYIETPFGPAIGHTGGDLGAMSQVRHFPDADATIVLLMNGGDGGVTGRLFTRLWAEAMELSLEDP